MFLNFANFYKKFIRKFSKIAISLILMLQITINNNPTTLTRESKMKHDVPDSVYSSNGSANGYATNDGFGQSIKNLSNLTQSKKLNLTKSKK